MAGRWKISYISWSLSRWRDLLESEETKKRIQIVDTSQYGPTRGNMARQDYQLFVCLLSRNLYVPVENFHSIAIKDQWTGESINRQAFEWRNRHVF